MHDPVKKKTGIYYQRIKGRFGWDHHPYTPATVENYKLSFKNFNKYLAIWK